MQNRVKFATVYRRRPVIGVKTVDETVYHLVAVVKVQN